MSTQAPPLSAGETGAQQEPPPGTVPAHATTVHPIDVAVRDLLSQPPSGGFTRMWRILALDRPRAVLGMLASALAAAITVYQPMLIQRLLNALPHATYRTMLALAGFITVLAVVASLLKAGIQIMLGRSANRTIQRLRTTAEGRVVEMPAGQLARHHVADLGSRCSSDAELVGNIVTQGPVQAVGSALTICGALLGMLYIDAVLSLIALAVSVVAFGTVIALSRRLSRLSFERQRALGEYVAEFHRSMSAIFTIRAFGASAFVGRRLRARSDRLRTAADASLRGQAMTGPTIEVAVQFSMLLLLSLGAWRAASGTLSSAALVGFLLYVVMLIVPVGSLSGTFSLMRTAMGAFDRLVELMAICAPQPRPAPPGPVVSAPRPMASPPGAAAVARPVPQPVQLDWRSHGNDVRFSGVSYGYPLTDDHVTGLTEWAVRDVSFDLPAGAWACLVGPSGSGKSTLLALMERFIEPTTGTIEVGGRDIQSTDPDRYRLGLGYVEQACPLFSGTVRDNLLLGRAGITDDACWAVLRDVGLADLVYARGGLDVPVGQSTVLLSGGERQRLAIARVLLIKPRILLLDEITSGLDAVNHGRIVRLIRERTSGVTTLAAGHRLAGLAESDLVVLLDKGQVVAVEEHASLRRTSRLYRSLLNG